MGLLADPQLKTVDLDPQAVGLINDTAARTTGMSAQDAQNQMQRNAFESADALGRQGPAQDSMSAAIRNQYGMTAGKDLDRIKRNNAIQSYMYKGQQLEHAGQMAHIKSQVMMQNYQMAAEAQAQNDMARAQMLSSILSLGGTAGAMGAQQARRPSAQGQQTQNSFNTGGGNAGGYDPGFSPGLDDGNASSGNGGNIPF